MNAQEKISAISAVLDKARYSQIDRPGRIGSLAKAVVGFAQRVGRSVAPETAEATAAMLDGDIAAYYGDSLAFSEVLLALEWGTRGEYGDSSSITADRLFRHVRAYASSGERVEAVRRSSPRALPQRVPLSRIRIENWDAAASVAASEWRDFLAGEFRPYFLPGRNGTCIPRRHALCAAYLWAKSVGLVADDAATRRTESDAMRKASEAGLGGSATAVYAGAIMFESLLCTYREAGVDLGASVEELRSTATDDEKDALRWKSLRRD